MADGKTFNRWLVVVGALLVHDKDGIERFSDRRRDFIRGKNHLAIRCAAADFRAVGGKERDVLNSFGGQAGQQFA